MPATPSRRFNARSREVVAYHEDRDRPGKPLHFLIPGGLLALVSFLVMANIVASSWVRLGDREAVSAIYSWLIPYAIGLFLFSYGYELYNWKRALAMTLFLGGLGITLVFVGLVLLRIFWLLLAGGAAAARWRELGSSNGGNYRGMGRRDFGLDSRSSASRTKTPESEKTRLARKEGRPLPKGYLSEFVCPDCGRQWPKDASAKCPYCPYVKA